MSKKFLHTSLWVAFFVLGSFGTGPAKSADLPPGTYQQTCRECHLTGEWNSSLECVCRGRDGNYHSPSTVRLDGIGWKCKDRKDIANVDGRLVCIQ